MAARNQRLTFAPRYMLQDLILNVSANKEDPQRDASRDVMLFFSIRKILPNHSSLLSKAHAFDFCRRIHQDDARLPKVGRRGIR